MTLGTATSPDNSELGGQPNETAVVRQLLEELTEYTGTDQLYLLSHDLQRLVSVIGDPSIHIDELMLARLADGEHFDSPADGTLVPYLHLDQPVLVSRHGGASPSRPAQSTYPALLVHDAINRIETLEYLRRVEDMSVAGQIQWDELAQRALRSDFLRVGGTLAPAYDVAGDLFDLAIQPNGSLAVVALDAMGRGSGAALSAVLALSAIRTRRREGASLEEQATAANRALDDEYGGDRFVTAVLLEVTDDRVDAVNAGHEPLRRYLHGQPVPQHIAAQPPLGVVADAGYKRVALEPFKPGETMVILSDGVSGARNVGGVTYGAGPVDLLVADAETVAPLALAHRVACAVTDHCSGTLHDDVTAVVLKAERR